MSGAAARKFFQYEGDFAMWRGGSLPDPVIAYETWGELNEARDNAILICTGLSPSAHAASSNVDRTPGWWEDMVGPDRAIDTHRYFVICMNSLGSCFGSTGAASIDPATGQPWRLEFPVLTLEDVAIAGEALIRHLGIEKLYCLAGPSMGGMTALAMAVLFPEVAQRLMLVSSAPRSLPFAIALRSLQRELICRDPDWEHGKYEGPGPVGGMRLARKLGMITYRSSEEWDMRFGRERISVERDPGQAFGMDFSVESYLEAHAVKFTGQFDSNCYLYLSRAMDLFDVAEHGGSVSQAMRRVRCDSALVIGVRTDFLFPLKQQQELADGLRAAGIDTRYEPLGSLQGHDSFLVDMDRFRPVIADYLA
jgi:homoserine O-acetyltransferase